MSARSHRIRCAAALLMGGVLALLGPARSRAQAPIPDAPSDTKPKSALAEGPAPPFALPYQSGAPEGVGPDLCRPDLSIDRYHPAPPPESSGPGRCWHFLAEGGFWLVQPYFSHNPAFTITRPLEAGSTAPLTSQTQEFDYRGHFSPWVTLGMINADGWGLRTSWWYYNQSDGTPFLANRDSTGRTTVVSAAIAGIPGFRSPSPTAQSLGVFGDRFNFTDHLRLDVYDWEGVRDFHGECWSLLVSGGVRYADLSQRYDAYRSNTGTGRSGTSTVVVREDSDTATSGHEFVGAGLTAALEAGRRLGCGFSLYGIVRGSVLFGRDKMQSFQRTGTSLQTTPLGGRSGTVSSALLFEGPGLSRTETLPLADFEVGVSWTRPFRGTSLFLQVGLADENWFSAGTATTDHGDLGFFGMRFAAGITY